MDINHFWSLGLGIKSIWSLNMSSKAMQTRVMPLQSNDPQSFIVILINFDCSSKLCFEEKSNSAIGDKIFKKSLQLISLGVVMVSVAKCFVMQSMQKVSIISSFEPKFREKVKIRVVLKSVKKC